MEFVFFLSWMFFAVAVGMFASIRRNRSGLGWSILAVIISPLFAFILIAILKEASPENPKKAWGSLGVVRRSAPKRNDLTALYSDQKG